MKFYIDFQWEVAIFFTVPEIGFWIRRGKLEKHISLCIIHTYIECWEYQNASDQTPTSINLEIDYMDQYLWNALSM